MHHVPCIVIIVKSIDIVARKKFQCLLIRPIGININIVAFFMDSWDKREKARISKLRGLMVVTGDFTVKTMGENREIRVYFWSIMYVHLIS